MTRDALILLVSARIDEIIPQGESPDGQGLVEGIAEAISDELDHSAWAILKEAPDHHLMEAITSDKKHFHGGSVKTTPTRVIKNADGSALVVCPDNYLRLISVKLSDSERPVTELMLPADPRLKLQYNVHTRGSKYNPKGALVPFSEYVTTGGAAVEETDGSATYPNCKKAIQIWSTDAEAPTLDHLHYIGKMKAEEIPEVLVDAMVWECASRALIIAKEYDGAVKCREMAVKAMA